jgi:hypothetical protein
MQPSIKQEMAEHLAAMMSPPAFSRGPGTAQVKRELGPVQAAADLLAAAPPSKRRAVTRAHAAATTGVAPPVRPAEGDAAAAENCDLCCDTCDTWYTTTGVGLSVREAEALEEWHCGACLGTDMQQSPFSSSSSYIGVTWYKAKKRWRAKIMHGGKRHQVLGFFVVEKAAARAYDHAARRLRGDQAHGGRGNNNQTLRLNFPTEEEIANLPPQSYTVIHGHTRSYTAIHDLDPQALETAERLVAQRRRTGQASSPYVGVSWFMKRGPHTKIRYWQARIRNAVGKQENLGRFDDELSAARAFDDAARRLRGVQAHGGRGSRAQGIYWQLNFPTQAEVAASATGAAPGPAT